MVIEYKVVVDNDGTTRWYNQDGIFHREDGPAIQYADGHKSWWINGKLHREDGPAIEEADGDKGWFLDSVEVTEEEVMGRDMTLEEISKAFGYPVRLKEV